MCQKRTKKKENDHFRVSAGHIVDCWAMVSLVTFGTNPQPFLLDRDGDKFKFLFKIREYSGKKSDRFTTLLSIG